MKRTSSSSSKDPIIQLFAKKINECTAGFKTPIEEKTAHVSRISLWNKLFPDIKMHPSTKVRELLLTVLRRYYINQTNATRFCFELATVFLGIPDYFFNFISSMPYPYTIAMKHAMKVLLSSISPPLPNASIALKRNLSTILSSKDLMQFSASIEKIEKNGNIDESMAEIKVLLNEHYFDLFLETLPSHIRLRYALAYGRPLPKFNINFEQVVLPFEFAQAIADIEGKEEGLRLLGIEPT